MVVGGMELTPLGLEVDWSDYARVTGDCVMGGGEERGRAKRCARCGLDEDFHPRQFCWLAR